ncbi:hypothetical protein [Teichococcus vastitatis]|uniref:Transposase DDE domain-containing protein n=2 Tax=Teichococcus vastitatis TaxID=2307076 RepID=A0ABS9W9A7_9PROT|nr:hypothetical protein [Pseudoroseomonas vastitatis]MCI0755340.1 hypothetical protein [Pseudoroseomonas vastitatis]
MTQFIPFSRDQAFLLPPDAKDWLPADDVAHFVYALRSRIECFINRLKNNRRVATRYDQTANSFFGFAALSSIRLWISFVHAS